MITKEFTVFGEQPPPNMDYLIGIPSGQIIDIKDNGRKYINYLKQDGIISFSKKWNSFCFNDDHYYKIITILIGDDQDGSDYITRFFDKQKNVMRFLVNKDGTVDVSGDIVITDGKFKKLPIKFKNVTGDFIFRNCELESLEGCPRKVGGDFNVVGNNLFDLNSGPIFVGKNYNCNDNYIQSLEGSPDRIFGNFDCSGNFLPNLIGGPKKVSGYFDCSENPLEFMDGRPECNNIVGGIKRKKLSLKDEGDGKMSW